MKKYTKLLFSLYKKNIAINILANMLVMVLTIASPIILRWYISSENGLGEPRVLVIYIVTLVASYLMMLFVKLYDLKSGYHFKVNESMRVIDMIFHMDYLELIKKEPTYLVEKISGSVDTIYLLFSKAFSGFFISSLTVIVTLILIARVNLVVFVLFLALIPVFWILPRRLNNELSKKSEKMQTISAKNNTLIKAVVSVPDAFKQISDKSGLFEMTADGFRTVQGEKRRINTYAGIFSLVIDFCMVFLTNLINIYSVYLFSNGQIDVSYMVFINLLSGIYLSALSNVINLDITIIDLKGALSYIDNEILAFEEDDGSEELGFIQKIDICIKDFGYNDLLISEACLRLNRGDVIGVFGESGGGKSSLLKMLLKYLPSYGITINDMPIAKIKNSDLRNRISYVSQNAYVFPGTILDNITLREYYDQKRLDKILDMSFLNKFYNLQNGLDTIVSENGANLSGGDKQRIMIARALLKESDIYIFDESFSALDEETAVGVENEVVSLCKKSIVIIVSHNRKLLEVVKKKYVLNKGVLLQENDAVADQNKKNAVR